MRASLSKFAPSINPLRATHTPQIRPPSRGSLKKWSKGGCREASERLRIDLPFGLGGFSMADSPMNGMALQFSRVVFAVEDMEIWNASSNGFSFVISYESSAGPGFHGRSISRPRTYGFVASRLPIHQNRCAVRIIGSPFKMLADAEKTCKGILGPPTSSSGLQ